MDKGTHQAHVLVGGPAYAGTDPRRFALIILNNMLGGPGMNSRLNLALREKAGLVYSVDSYLNTYPDTGFWNVYFGCDTHDVKRCRRLLERELCRFIDKPLTAAQLAAAKNSCADRWAYRPMPRKAMPWPLAKPLRTMGCTATSSA